MKQKLLLLVVGLLLPLLAQAQAVITIYDTYGVVKDFAVCADFDIKVQDDNVLEMTSIYLTGTTSHDLNYSLAWDRSYTFTCRKSSGMEAPIFDDEQLYIDGSRVVLKEGETGSRIDVYSTDGELLASAKCNKDGYAELDVQDLHGILVVKTSRNSLKLIR